MSHNQKRLLDFLYYIDILDKRYAFDDSEIKRQIQVLKDKHNNKNCNLGIIGESSAGKSSFINSVLGESLLESDVLLNTTISNTIITYGKKKKVKISKKNGDELFFENDIKDIITKYTSDLSLSSDVDTITIYYPSKFLKKGINIVDTPGISGIEKFNKSTESSQKKETSEAAKLDNTTETAIKDILDSVLVLTPTTQSFSFGLKVFIDRFVYDNIDNCLFVLTKLDLLPKKDFDRTKKYCTSLIKSNWNASEDKLFFYSSYIDKKKIDKEFIRIVQSESQKTLLFIYSYIKKQKEKIKYNKELFIIEKTSSLLEQGLKNRLEAYKEKHNRLESAIKPDFNDFLNHKKNCIDSYINSEITKTNSVVVEKGNQNSESIVKKYIEAIDSSDTAEALQNNCKNFENDLKKVIFQYQQAIQKNLKQIENWYIKEIQSFQNDFTQLYNSLPLLEYNITGITEKTDLVVQKNYKDSIQNIDSSVTKVDDKTFLTEIFSQDNNNWITPFLATVGVNFGLPGILISLAGGLLVKIFGEILGSIKFQKQKEDLKNKINDAVKNCFDFLINDFNKQVNLVKDNILADSRNIFTEYQTKYSDAVKKLRDADEKEKNEINKKIKEIEFDIGKIQEYKKYFNNNKL